MRVVATKWGDRPHWEFDATWLGSDEHGGWVGVPVGTVITRPGATVVTRQLQVVLFPEDRGFVSTYYEPVADPPCAVYVDIATPPVVSPGRVESVDLDLDVLRGRSGRVWVDDEDEFTDHQVRWDYPPEVVIAALATCEAVRADLAAGAPPFDGVHEHWLAALRRSTVEG